MKGFDKDEGEVGEENEMSYRGESCDCFPFADRLRCTECILDALHLVGRSYMVHYQRN